MVVLAVIAGLAAGALVAVAASRLLAAHLGRQATADRDATVRQAVEATLAVAGDRLGQHAQAGARELELHRQAIGQQLHSMGAELRTVSDLVATLQRERAEQHGAVLRGLDEAMRTTSKLADTTQSLRQALASPKARGQWGERMADDVLRLAGMCEGVNYLKQKSIAGGRVPDFTFLLPRGLSLHMDVKFPVDNYLRFLEAATDVDRSRCRDAFLRDVRARVKDLAGRGYADASDTVGYQLLFIPNESVYSFIGEHQPELGESALRQKVVLCSPFTLFAVLGVVRQAVDSFLLERTTDEILAAMHGFSQQWDRFSEQVDLVGRRLASAQSAYDDLAGTRRRQLQRQLDEIDHIRTERGLEPEPEPESGGDALRVLPNASNL
ncbi:MAG: DNA recombination protein RmuC [Acidimicrobiales bacterium]